MDRCRGASVSSARWAVELIGLIAPSWRLAIARTAVFLSAAALVFGGMYLSDGAPAARRRVMQNEVARFTPSFGHGLVQLLGETGLVLLVALIARRGLKIRL
jgi:hypothetical protein